MGQTRKLSMIAIGLTTFIVWGAWAYCAITNPSFKGNPGWLIQTVINHGLLLLPYLIFLILLESALKKNQYANLKSGLTQATISFSVTTVVMWILFFFGFMHNYKPTQGAGDSLGIGLLFLIYVPLSSIVMWSRFVNASK